MTAQRSIEPELHHNMRAELGANVDRRLGVDDRASRERLRGAALFVVAAMVLLLAAACSSERDVRGREVQLRSMDTEYESGAFRFSLTSVELADDLLYTYPDGTVSQTPRDVLITSFDVTNELSETRRLWWGSRPLSGSSGVALAKSAGPRHEPDLSYGSARFHARHIMRVGNCPISPNMKSSAKTP